MPIVNKFPIGGEKIIDGTNIFGVSWDNPPDPVLTRTDLSASFPDPVPALSNGTGTSKFDKYLPWRGIVREDVAGAGACVKIPKFWYKLTQNGDGFKLQIADYAASGFSVSPAHMDRGDGKGVRDYIYVGRYHCASDYTSKTGVNYKASVNAATMRNGIHALGANIWEIDFTTVFTIWLLYLVEFANFNSQNMIGKGVTQADNYQTSYYAMGRTDGMQYHTGTQAGARSSYGSTQYRYIEDMWSNGKDFVTGGYRSSNSFYIAINPSKFAEVTNGTLAGDLGISGFPSSCTVYNPSGLYPLFLPAGAAGGTNTNGFCDKWNISSGQVLVWGASGNDRNFDVGLFHLESLGTGSSTNVVTSRLMVLP